MRSLAAQDPDLTSGLLGFNPGRAHFQGNCVCLFLLACCLLLFVFFFLAEPGGKAEKQSREAVLRVVIPLRFRYVSVTFPLRFRCVSVAFPRRASPRPLPRGKCEGSLCQRGIIKETCRRTILKKPHVRGQW